MGGPGDSLQRRPVAGVEPPKPSAASQPERACRPSGPRAPNLGVLLGRSRLSTQPAAGRRHRTTHHRTTRAPRPRVSQSYRQRRTSVPLGALSPGKVRVCWGSQRPPGPSLHGNLLSPRPLPRRPRHPPTTTSDQKRGLWGRKGYPSPRWRLRSLLWFPSASPRGAWGLLLLRPAPQTPRGLW